MKKIICVLTTFGLLALSGCFSITNAKAKSPVYVVLETERGNIELAINVDKAPLSSASFLKAIDHSLFVDGGGFWRAVCPDNDRGSAIEVIQGRVAIENLVTAQQSTLPLIDHESTKQTGLRHLDGTFSLGRAKGSTGSGATFFICIGEQPGLDYGGKNTYNEGEIPDALGFSAFGKVTRGMEVVRAIQERETLGTIDYAPLQGQILTEPVTILKAYRK